MMSHRLTAFVAIAALAGAAACSRTEPEQPAAPVEPSAAPASNAPSVGYACESGATLQVQYIDSDNAKLTHHNQTYTLRSVQAVPIESVQEFIGPSQYRIGQLVLQI